MKLPNGKTGGATQDPQSLFRVVIVYDDFAAGRRAMNTCNFLLFQLGEGVELRSSMWKFDVLRSAKLSQIALEDAIEADVIIVANSRNGELPGEVRHWVDGWVPRKQGQRGAVLIALLDFSGEETGCSAQARAFLKDAAALAKIDFLPQEVRFGKVQWPATGPAPVPRAASPKESAFENRPLESWGLND